MRQNRKFIIALFLPLFLLSVSCATLDPNANKTVVRTEQALKVSLSVYEQSMEWYTKNFMHLNDGTKEVFLTVNKEFPTVYRSTDSALQLYKANKANDLIGQMEQLNKLVVQLLTLVKINGGPDFAPKAAPAEVK